MARLSAAPDRGDVQDVTIIDSNEPFSVGDLRHPSLSLFLTMPESRYSSSLLTAAGGLAC
jgi:hypothetical protein